MSGYEYDNHSVWHIPIFYVIHVELLRERGGGGREGGR